MPPSRITFSSTRLLAALLVCAGGAMVAAGASRAEAPRDLGAELSADPDNVSPFDALAAACFSADAAPEDVIAACTRLLDAGALGAARSAGALTRRAEALVALGARSRAIGDFTRAIALAPNDAELWRARCEARLALGVYAHAVEDCSGALARDPRNAAAFAARGKALLKLGAPKLAGADLSQALALRPDDAETHRHLGLVLVAEGALEPALAAFSAAIAERPEDPTAYADRGRARLSADDAAGAVEDFDAALARDPSIATAREARGDALAALGRPRDALADYLAAFERRPLPTLLQRIEISLAEAGLAPGPVDGVFDPDTRAAIAAFRAESR